MSIAFSPGLVRLLLWPRFPGRPTRLRVGIAEVGAVACRQVSVLGAQFAVACCQPPVGASFLVATASQVSHAVAIFGAPVSLLSAIIALIGTFNQDLDAGIGLDGVHLVHDRVLVTLTLVGFFLTPVGSAISTIDPPVTPIDPSVTPIDPAVTPIGVPVAPVRHQVPPSASISLVGGVVPLTSRPVARLTGKLSLRRDLAVQVRNQIAALRRLPTLLRRLRAVASATHCFPVGRGSPHLLLPLDGDPVTLVGDVGTLVSRPVTLVGDTAAFVRHAVALVGGALALALLGLGSHRASLPQCGANALPDQSCIGSGRT